MRLPNIWKLNSCDVNRSFLLGNYWKLGFLKLRSGCLFMIFFLRSSSMGVFKSVFKVAKSRSHVVNYSFKFILPCNYIYVFFSPLKPIAYRILRGLGVAWKFWAQCSRNSGKVSLDKSPVFWSVSLTPYTLLFNASPVFYSLFIFNDWFRSPVFDISTMLDPDIMKKSGRILLTAELGREYGFKDVGGE